MFQVGDLLVFDLLPPNDLWNGIVILSEKICRGGKPSWKLIHQSSNSFGQMHRSELVLKKWIESGNCQHVPVKKS